MRLRRNRGRSAKACTIAFGMCSPAYEWPKTAECLKSGFHSGSTADLPINLFKATNPPGAHPFRIFLRKGWETINLTPCSSQRCQGILHRPIFTTSPFTLSNSRVLAVTKMRFLQKTCPAISVSYSPMRRPCLSSSVRISPAACASCSCSPAQQQRS